jgi:hypothetical protein
VAADGAAVPDRAEKGVGGRPDLADVGREPDAPHAKEDVMFEQESDVARRRATPAPEKSEPSIDALRQPRPMGVHDAASLMHLQRLAGNAGVVQMLAEEGAVAQEEQSSPVHDVVGKGGGSPLDESIRSSMESGFGQDFGDVRVHTDGQASKSAESVGANAYTVGNDIVFRSGHFDAASPTGQRTIAHELSHVVQQRSGPVEGTEAPGGIRLSDPSDKFERAADATADQVIGGSTAPAAPAAGSGTAVQLEEAEDEAAAPVQREMGGQEDEEEAGAGAGAGG